MMADRKAVRSVLAVKASAGCEEGGREGGREGGGCLSNSGARGKR